MPKLLRLSEDYITIHFPYTTLFQDFLKRLAIQSPPHRNINVLIVPVCVTEKQSCGVLLNQVILDKSENTCSTIFKCFDCKCS